MASSLTARILQLQLAALLAISGASACGSDDDPPQDGPEMPSAGSGGGGNPSPGDECRPAGEAIDPTALIDDLEDQNAMLPPISGRSGGWWTAGDMTPGATLEPAGGGDAFPVAMPTARCGSSYAMRVSGQGFNEWGAVLGLSLVYTASGPGEYDASAHTGVTFWARVGDTSTNQVRFAISDRNSQPEGGICVLDGPAETDCYDTFGTVITNLETRWKRYKVPFTGLSQRNFGLPADALVTDGLYAIQFTFEPGSVFDLWIDDIEFY